MKKSVSSLSLCIYIYILCAYIYIYECEKISFCFYLLNGLQIMFFTESNSQPCQLFKYLNKYVNITQSDGTSLQGWVYTIDPVSLRFELLSCNITSTNLNTFIYIWLTFPHKKCSSRRRSKRGKQKTGHTSHERWHHQIERNKTFRPARIESTQFWLLVSKRITKFRKRPITRHTHSEKRCASRLASQKSFACEIGLSGRNQHTGQCVYSVALRHRTMRVNERNHFRTS